MMVKIRMTRLGRKKLPSYRIVVADERRARDGRFIEILGWYQPLNKEKQYELNAEKALVWLKKGAKPSDTAKSLLKKAGVMKAYHEHQCELAGQRKARRAEKNGQPAAAAAPEADTAPADVAPAEIASADAASADVDPAATE